MALVNYVKESLAFMEHATDNGFTANERLLWYALFHIMNMRAKGNNWPDGFISISNKRLLSFLPFSEDGMFRARNSLSQRGLIKYEKGKKNTASPLYRLVYFSTEQIADDSEVECYPQIAGNTGGNITGNMQGKAGGNITGNMQGNMGDIIYKHNINDNVTPNGFDDEDEDDDGYAHATREAVEIIVPAFLAQFGRPATPAELQRLAVVTANLNLAPLIGHAIQRAAVNGAKNPIAYISSICADWHSEHLQTVAELEEYQFLRDCAEGRADHVSMDGAEAYRILAEKRQERFEREYANEGNE